MNSQKGFSLVEILVAMAIMSLVGVALLSGLATGIKTTDVAEEHAIAESLVRSQIEYIENHTYVKYPSQYPLNPSLVIPIGWEVPVPAVSLVHATDDGLQKITVTAVHRDKTVLTLDVIKVNRN